MKITGYRYETYRMKLDRPIADCNLPSGFDLLPGSVLYIETDESITGISLGLPQFTAVESEAAALDLDDLTEGVQPHEALDVVDQVSVAWVEQLEKWVTLYGGGMINLPLEPGLPNCGVLELFTDAECKLVEIGDGAFYLRTADQPWGPWSAPQKVISGGDQTPMQGHPMIPLLQVTSHDVSAQNFSHDMDACFQTSSAYAQQIRNKVLQLVCATASGEYQPHLSAAVNADFQLTRGYLGVSL